MKRELTIGLVLLTVVSILGCVSEPRPNLPLPEAPATVETVAGGTVAGAPTSAPAATHVPSPEPTAPPSSISTVPSPPTLRPTPTPRPTLVPVNSAGQRSETIITSLGQQVDVVAKGFDDSPLRFDQLVQSINDIEQLLKAPFPSPKVLMTRVASLEGGFCGHNQVEYAPRHSGAAFVISDSVIRLRVDDSCNDTFASIAHETAHTWFHGNDPADWIDEGLANAIEQQVTSIHRPEEVVYPPITYCESHRNLAELESGNHVRVLGEVATGYKCNYTLGDGIFGALREHHGDEAFNRQVVPLARRLTNDSNREYTIEDIREFLGGDEIALDIINTWYAGQPETRNYRHLDAVEWTFPPTIDGDHLHFAGRTTEPELVHDFVLGNDQYCSQFSLYRGIRGQEWVTSVADPLPIGRTHSSAKLIVINSSITPETGGFWVTARIVDEALSNLDDLSLSVHSRVTTGADGLCRPSVRYSQVAVVKGKIPEEVKAVKYYSQEAVEWTFPPTIDGDYLHFAGRTDGAEMVHEFALGKDSFCSQFSLYRNGTSQKWIASVADPLPAGWQHDVIPKLVVINHSIHPGTGEFRVTARINEREMLQVDELSLAVQSRVAVEADGLCKGRTTYSQAPIVTGIVPAEFKVVRHHSLNAVEWISPPTISGNTLRFVGRSLPGTVRLTWREGYCGQFFFYDYGEGGYRHIGNLAPSLPGNRSWSDPFAEVFSYRVSPDGTFEAIVRLSENALAGYVNPVLLVATESIQESETNRCRESDTLSAVTIR